MKRVIMHWTAGTNEVSDIDWDHYHFIVDGKGATHTGNHPVSDNESTEDGVYAAHTKGCNTDSIGVAVCGMAGAVEHPFYPGSYPITKFQVLAMCNLVAELCFQYKIPVTPQTVLTHAEVQPNLGIKQDGKWDISWLPWQYELAGYEEAGNWYRRAVTFFLDMEYDA